MRGIYDWLRMAAGLILVIAVFDLFLPANDSKKLAKLVMGLVIMLVLLEPLLALVYSGWELDTLSLGLISSPANVDWAGAGSQIYSAGMRPVMQYVSENTAYQLEALLLSSTAIQDARIQININQEGLISSVDVRIIPAESGNLDSDLQELTELVIDLVSRYLQTAESNINVEID